MEEVGEDEEVGSIRRPPGWEIFLSSTTPPNSPWIIVLELGSEPSRSRVKGRTKRKRKKKSTGFDKLQRLRKVDGLM